MTVLKRFLDGLIFGAGFAIAFIAIWTIAVWFVFPAMVGDDVLLTSDPIREVDPIEEVQLPPEILRSNEFLGSTGRYFGRFSRDNSGVLSSGPGQIIGTAMVDGEPLEGLRLRLALNGSVLSQWATTGAAGRYDISVPFGKYQINGFELDSETADSVLAGKIGRPQNPISSSTFEVAAGAPGHGLDLEFVEPVVLDIPKTRFSADEEIIIRWQPYPGAQDYAVQIYEGSDELGFGKGEPMFRWSERLIVNESRIIIADFDFELKAGHYYTVHVEARADTPRPISRNARNYARFDFEVVE